jgi:hypothetical protein
MTRRRIDAHGGKALLLRLVEARSAPNSAPVRGDSAIEGMHCARSRNTSNELALPGRVHGEIGSRARAHGAWVLHVIVRRRQECQT